MKNKDKKTKYLGMPVDTAKKKLKNNLLFDLACQLGYNFCYKCKELISSPEVMSVEHKIQWLDKDPDLFWNLNNVAFGHKNCEEEIKKMSSIIDVTIENEQGKILPTYCHNEKLYVAGKRGERYNIRIKNKHLYLRSEVIVTVDGRDVISGKIGDSKNGKGYIVKANDDILIKGFRQTDNKVAAFRFSNPDDSYSDRMGSGAHVGVIGIASYKEYDMFKDIGDFNYLSYKPYNNPVHTYTYAEHNPWTISTNNINLNTVYGSCGTYGSNISSGKEIKTSGKLKSEIGTEYGESIGGKVTKTNFKRENSSVPDEIWTVTYDTIDGLKKRGVIVENNEPNPFPASPQVSPGYAKPPPPKK